MNNNCGMKYDPISSTVDNIIYTCDTCMTMKTFSRFNTVTDALLLSICKHKDINTSAEETVSFSQDYCSSVQIDNVKENPNKSEKSSYMYNIKESATEVAQKIIIQDYKKVVTTLTKYLQDMENEYNKEDTCDYTKITRLIEESATYTAAVRAVL